MLEPIAGITIGHSTDSDALTGCTVILVPGGAVGGVDVRGSAPGTRETDLLRPMNVVTEAHAILLSGGSAFGLAAADGVVRHLEEQGVGFDAGVAKVPIVPAAVIFDLDLGDPAVRPGAAMGHAACEAAAPQPQEGNVGAGAGATVGKALGAASRMKGGLGTAGVRLQSGAVVSALAVVNAVGDVLDETGAVLAGARNPEGGWLDSTRFFMGMPGGPESPLAAMAGNSTTLVVVMTDAELTKEDANKVAQMAHDGVARAISPVHTSFDGDTIFVLATSETEAPPMAVGVAAAEMTAQAIRSGVRAAHSVADVPGLAG